MYRKYIEDLKKWLNNPRRKPLMIWGARQTGKSYLVEELFAKQFFANKYVYIDCRTERDIVHYCSEHINATEVLNYISLKKNINIDKNVLLIFDEAQECLPIITLMKYFCQDYREIPIIVTGSMVRIKIKRYNNKRGPKIEEGFLFPVGKIDELYIYPMNFEEYLINRNKVLYTYLVDAYHKKTAISSEMHELSLSVFYEYLLIGGMPEAVDIFLETGSYQLSREVLKTLYNNYLSDMDLYQASSESIIRSRKIYEEIFSQLNKESKNFSPSLIGKGLKSRDLLSPIDWLTTSFIVEKSFLVNEIVTCPLVSINDSLFRLYLCDIGMFSYQSNIDPTYFISKESRNYFSGIFFENYVANELTNVGVKLFYWKGKNNSELEFIIQQNYEIIPIDVKKTKGKLGSLEKFKNHNKCNLAIKISSNQFGYDSTNKILTIPFYYVFLLCKDIINNSVFEVVKDLN